MYKFIFVLLVVVGMATASNAQRKTKYETIE